MRGRVKLRLCKPEESRFAPGGASPDSENSQLCWGGAESPWETQEIPSTFPSAPPGDHHPEIEATSDAKEQTTAAGPATSLGGQLLSLAEFAAIHSHLQLRSA